MNEFVQGAMTRVKENKGLIIRVGSTLVGALLGATVGGMLADATEDDIFEVESEAPQEETE